MAKRGVVPGDVLEIEAPDGFVYVHFLGTHREYGDGIFVCPVLHPAPALVTRELFEGGYFVFYPAKAAVARGLASVVAHLSSPGVPSRLRRPGARSGKTVTSWVVEEGTRDEIRSVLTQEERRLPIAVIWNHEFLVRRVREGWRPDEAGAVASIQEVPAPERDRERAMQGPQTKLVSHYLYFPKRDSAFRVANRLRKQGFAVEDRLGADGTNWLVLVRHRVAVASEEFASARSAIETLARQDGGEYDGWEAET